MVVDTFWLAKFALEDKVNCNLKIVVAETVSNEENLVVSRDVKRRTT